MLISIYVLALCISFVILIIGFVYENPMFVISAGCIFLILAIAQFITGVDVKIGTQLNETTTITCDCQRLNATCCDTTQYKSGNDLDIFAKYKDPFVPIILIFLGVYLIYLAAANPDKPSHEHFN